MSFAVSHLPITTTPRATIATGTTFPTPASARVHTATTATTTMPTVSTPASAKVPPTATTTTTAPTPATSTPGGLTVKPLTSTNARAHVRARSSSPTHVSTEAIIIAAIAALLLLACAAWAFARSRAYEPHWLVSLRHAMAEAGFRMSSTWAEFTDWARLGR
jgi:hypothetical protein